MACRTLWTTLSLSVTLLVTLGACGHTPEPLTSAPITKPNIVLIMSDDQGYGDVGLHNNPIISTPNLDALAKQSARLTNFHVDPTCSPTRAALLSGKGSLKAGVWHTVMTRYMLGPEHVTLAEHLQQGGYDTAIFGKWHLGDNYPYRPQDQGFQEVLIHGGGGVGQTPDYWGNTQFNDTYYRNGQEQKFAGYATKIWFDEAIKYIEQKRNNPYFAYISLNAPHGPYRAPEEYIKPYLDKGLHREWASFYAMITYLDEQVARLRKVIQDRGEEDNTIFIFMTDNGSSYHPTDADNNITKRHQPMADKYPQWQANGGMRGYKASTFEGGHRVPFFISYPKGGIKAGEYNTLTAHFDLLPTLLELAGLSASKEELDGQSLATLLTQGSDQTLEERSIVVTNQRVNQPSAQRPIVVAYKNWRLLSANGEEQLYDLNRDPQQMHNVLVGNVDIANTLRLQRQNWWDEAAASGFTDRYISVGNEAENPVRLNAMDWMEIAEEKNVPWFIGHQGPADEYDYVHWLTREQDFKALPWYIDVEQTSRYQVRAYFHDIPAATPIMKNYCVIEADGQRIVERVWGRASHCVANLQLTAGKQKISAWFTDDKNTLEKEKAAFYLYLEKL